MKYLSTLPFLAFALQLVAQPNCNVYRWEGDTAQYQACLLLENELPKYYQFSKEFHQLVDSAIAICPWYAYAYREKSAPYVKAGNFVEWKKIIDLAVKYDTLEYLPDRASLRYKFFADYRGTIEDIEFLEKKTNGTPGVSSNGTYNLLVVKALCYKMLGNRDKAIEILQAFVDDPAYNGGLYDYLHLGVLYLETGNYALAEKFLLKQNASYEYADTYYYLACCYKKTQQQEEYVRCAQKAKALILTPQKLFDPYHGLIDQVYQRDLENL